MRAVVALALILLSYLAAATSRDQCGMGQTSTRFRRIIRGDSVVPHQYPWVVSVQFNGSHICGGAVLNEYFVLTSGHCFVQPTVHEPTVVAGLHVLQPESTEAVAVNGTVILHPDYIRNDVYRLSYDLALIQLHQPLSFTSTIQPICLAARDDQPKTGEKVHIAGWGQEYTNWDLLHLEEKNLSSLSVEEAQDVFTALFEMFPVRKELKQLTLHLEGIDECSLRISRYYSHVTHACEKKAFNPTWCGKFARSFGTDGIVDDDVLEQYRKELNNGDGILLCASPNAKEQRRSSACRGDSGSPLMKQMPDGSWALIGVANVAPYDCIMQSNSFPQVGVLFVDVRPHLGWIQSTLHRHLAEAKDAIAARTSGDEHSLNSAIRISFPVVMSLVVLCLSLSLLLLMLR